MPDDWHKIETSVRYRDLAITLLGTGTAGLLAIAGYDTQDEVAIAAIAVKHRDDRHLYCLAGTNKWTTSADLVAEAAVQARRGGPLMSGTKRRGMG